MAFDTDYSKLYKSIYGTNYESKHADIFPRNIFMILAGSTNSGKQICSLILLWRDQ